MINAESFTEIEPLHQIVRREEKQTAKHLIQSLGSDILGSPSASEDLLGLHLRTVLKSNISGHILRWGT